MYNDFLTQDKKLYIELMYCWEDGILFVVPVIYDNQPSTPLICKITRKILRATKRFCLSLSISSKSYLFSNITLDAKND